MANSSMSAAAVAPASCEPAHAASSGSRPNRRLLNARSTASRSGRGEMNRCGTRTPAPAQETREAFSFMSPIAGQATTAHPRRALARGSRARRGRRRRRRGASCASRRPSRRCGRWRARAASGGEAAVPGGEHAHGRVGEPSQRGREHPVRGVLRGRGGDEHERLIARRSSTPRPGAPTSAARRHARAAARRAGTRAGETWRRARAGGWCRRGCSRAPAGQGARECR